MNDLSRRTVLGAAATAVAASSTVVAPVPAATATGRPVAARAFTTAAGLYRRSRYLPLRGKRFTLSGPNAVSERVTLVEIGDLPFAEAGAERAFVLTFHCAGEGPAQGTYALSRRGFDKTSMFLVPADGGRQTYHAVVDRRR